MASITLGYTITGVLTLVGLRRTTRVRLSQLIQDSRSPVWITPQGLKEDYQSPRFWAVLDFGPWRTWDAVLGPGSPQLKVPWFPVPVPVPLLGACYFSASKQILDPRCHST